MTDFRATENESTSSLRRLNAELSAEIRMRAQAEAALAIERDRINAALGQSELDLAQQRDDWQHLHAMSMALLEARTLDDQLQVVLAAFASFHKTDRALVTVFDRASGDTTAQFSLGLSDRARETFSTIRVGTGICGVAFERGERIIVSDTQTDPLCLEYREFARQESIKALYARPFFNNAGEPLGVLSVYFADEEIPSERELRLTDICATQIGMLVERAHSEAQARHEEERSHHILQTLRDGFVLMDRDFRILQINAAGLALDGRAETEIVGRTHWEVWPGSELQEHGRAYIKAMRTREPVRFENNYDYFGRDCWFDVYAYPYGDGLAILYRDISQQKKAERDRIESEKRYSTLISSMDEGYCILKVEFSDEGQPSDYRFLETNSAFEQQTGLASAVGKSILELVPTIERSWIDIYGRVAATGEPIRMINHSEALGRWYDVYATRIGDPAEHQVALLFKDITEQKKAEADLRRLADDLARINQHQSEFLATLAHELRNPLAPIRTGLDVIRMRPTNVEAIAEVRQMMERQTDHLIHLVNDLLDLARIRNGKISLNLERASLKDIVLSAVETISPMIEKKRQHTDLHLPDATIWVEADRNRLAQVIGNLLSNASRYTDNEGCITVSLRQERDEALIEVSDNGIGIAPQSLPYIFDIFTQAGRGLSQAQGGLGVGLSVVKRLTEMHHGRVEVRSEGEGRGSCFTIGLPALRQGPVPPDDKTQHLNHSARTRPLRILLADDNRDAVAITKELLTMRGHEVETAFNGSKALEIAQRHLPDIALLDIGMPELNGFELAQALRKLPGGEHVRLIALTGWGTEEDRAHTRAAGFDQHLTKPIDLETLDRLLATL